jgi:pimeloyl-ACP methyl ester carboxylesterase
MHLGQGGTGGTRGEGQCNKRRQKEGAHEVRQSSKRLGMVAKGQFLERPALIPVDGLVLEGLWHRGPQIPSLLILSPLPEDGGSMDHVLAAELAWASAQAGHPSLRFNYRGVGGSQGEKSGLAEYSRDTLAALELLRANANAPHVLVAAIGSARSLIDVLFEDAAVLGVAHLDPTVQEPATSVRGRIVLRQFPVDPGLRQGLPQAGRNVAQWLMQLASAVS